MKKNKIKLLSLSIFLSIIFSQMPQDVIATEFEGQESKYYSLCIANELSKNDKKICEEFNNYLSKRNTKLQNELQESKNNKRDAKQNIEQLKVEISKIDEQVDEINKEIEYFENAIINLENQIYDKEELLKDRMYSVQSLMNSNAFLQYIFDAENLVDFFSRQSAITELLEYDNELIDVIRNAKEDLEKQKETLDLSKQNLESKQYEQRVLQQDYIRQLEAYDEVINKTSEQISATQESMDLLNRNIEAITQASNESYVEGIVNATPNEPVYERDNNGNIIDVNNSDMGIKIANMALSRQGYMYVWGGAHSMNAIMNPNHTEFDCSGLVNWAFYQSGINIGIQYTGSLVYMGKKVEKGHLQAGDIILFSDNGDISGVHHVGIYIGNNQMVHAPTTGRPVQVANLGTSYWQREWFVARRLHD